MSAMMISKDLIVQKYKLTPHPEGGYFKETFRSDVQVEMKNEEGVMISRTASTAIYFLMTPGNVSRFHRIKSDEVWHFYLGTSISVIELDEETGGFIRTIVGPNILNGETVQYTVKAGRWFGSFPNAPAPVDLSSMSEDTFSFVGIRTIFNYIHFTHYTHYTHDTHDTHDTS